MGRTGFDIDVSRNARPIPETRPGQTDGSARRRRMSVHLGRVQNELVRARSMRFGAWEFNRRRFQIAVATNQL